VVGCHELQVLVLPEVLIVPSGTVFARLSHLEVSDHERDHPLAAGVMGLWELMASGGLPALAKLSVAFDDRLVVDKVRTRMAAAFEAVSGTLTHLHLDERAPIPTSVDLNVPYELGVDVGKLRRLKDLSLNLSGDGRAYHALAQGLAASGVERPLPLLWRVEVLSQVDANADLMASLLLPSVRLFGSRPLNDRTALLTACAMRQVGYQHTWILQTDYRAIVVALVPCTNVLDGACHSVTWRCRP
jgi:hypothetical protein